MLHALMNLVCSVFSYSSVFSVRVSAENLKWVEVESCLPYSALATFVLNYTKPGMRIRLIDSQYLFNVYMYLTLCKVLSHNFI